MVRHLILLFLYAWYILNVSAANLNTYIISYLRVGNPEVTYADWVIVSTTKPVILGLFMTFSGELSRRIGLRLSLAIGASIYSVGVVTTGLALDANLWVVTLTLGACHGFALCLAYAQAIEVAMKVRSCR